VSDRHRAEQLGAGADRDVVLNGGMALAAREAGAAERDALVERHPVTDLGRLADHDPGAVVDEEVLADLRRGMDLDPGDRPARERDRPRRERHARVVDRMCHAVGEQRLYPRPRGEDLDRADPAGCRIAFARRSDVGADLVHDPAQGPESEHDHRVERGAGLFRDEEGE
jgi:hypothetical protein